MKRFAVNLSFASLCVSFCGCTSLAVIDEARGYKSRDADGMVAAEQEARPGFYALLPLTIPLDVALLAAWAYAEGFAYDFCGGGSSSGSGLKVRPAR